MNRDNELFAIATIRCKKELGKSELNVEKDLLPYLAEHKNEIMKELEDINDIRSDVLKTHIKEHIQSINDLLDLL
jgi:hypothetical protein